MALRFRDELPPWPVSFELHEGAPFTVELGRGSGLDGLATVKIESSGRVELCRERHRATGERDPKGERGDSWEVTTFQLPPAGVAQVVEAVNESRVLGLSGAYHEGRADGTQWVLRIRQGEHDAATYFDNRFPRAVRELSSALDRVVSEHMPAGQTWHETAAPHDDELWASIHRP